MSASTMWWCPSALRAAPVSYTRHCEEGGPRAPTCGGNDAQKLLSVDAPPHAVRVQAHAALLVLRSGVGGGGAAQWAGVWEWQTLQRRQ